MKKKNKKYICVFCGSSEGNTNLYLKSARKAGEIIGKYNFNLVYGAGGVGLMGQVANSAYEHGIKIIGVIPTFLTKKETPMKRIRMIKTKTMRTRKAKMYNLADIFLVLSGGLGTLDELTEVLTLIQLKQIERKKLLILNTKNYWNDFIKLLKKMVNEGFLNQKILDSIVILNNISELDKYLKNIDN